MKKRMLGKTGLKVTEIGVGCWAIGGPFINLGISGGWGNVSTKDAKQGLLEAVKMGANIFDTADVYGLGESERLLGWLIEKCQNEGKKREDFVIVSKTGYFKGCASHGFDPLHMKHQLEMSLQNLKTKYIDIYFFHHLDFGKNNKYLKGALERMKEFRRNGLVNFIGLRGPHKFSFYRGKNANFKGDYDSFVKLAEIIEPDVISVRYNMITPTYDKPESDIFKWAKEMGIGVLIYKPLGQGLLLDKYDPHRPPKFQIGDHRIRKAWFGEKGLTILKNRIAIIKERFGITTTKELVQLCIKYCLSRDDSACVLVGFKNKKQIAESLSTHGYLKKTDLEFIKNVFRGVSEEIGEFTNFKKEDKHATSVVF